MTNHYNQTYSRRLETASKLLRSYRRLNGFVYYEDTVRFAKDNKVNLYELQRNWKTCGIEPKCQFCYNVMSNVCKQCGNVRK